MQAGFKPNLNDYPIYKEEHRPVLNQKIINHYWFREIGFETPDRFNWALRCKMMEIMAVYNKMFVANEIEYNPLETDVFISNQAEYSLESYTDTHTGFSNFQGSQAATQAGSNYITGNYNDQTSGTTTGNENRTDNITRDKNWGVDTDTTNDQTSTSHGSSTTNNTTTNDLTQTDNGTKTTATTSSSTDSKTHTMSDTPQANISADNIDWKYMTQRDSDSASSSGKQDTTDTTQDTRKNTGTVKDEGTGTADSNGTVNDTGTKSETGNEGETEDHTITGKTDGKSTGTASGGNSTKSNNQSTQSQQNNETQTNANQQVGQKGRNDNRQYRNSGRSGKSPAQLIAEYRQNLVDIDGLVIQSLDELFMGVF